MKIKILTLIVFLFVAPLISAQTGFDKWIAIKEFHDILAQTFHPAEEGNVEPIKLRSEELMTKANNLLQLDIPEEFRTKEILTLLENLQIRSKTLHALVLSKASNEEITKSITEIHAVFHEIVGLCTEEKN